MTADREDTWDFVPTVWGRPYLVRAYPNHRAAPFRDFVKVYRLGSPFNRALSKSARSELILA
jgi:hypothetical protein